MSIYFYKSSRPKGHTVEFKDSVVIVDYPDSSTWTAEIVLEEGRVDYEYRLISQAGTPTPWKSLQVKLSKTDPEEKDINNSLDGWGTLLDTKRLPGESNRAYKTRLLDVYVHKGSSTHNGLINSICRDLSLSYEDEALVVLPNYSATTGKMFDNISMAVTCLNVKVTSTDLVVEENVIPDEFNRVNTSRSFFKIISLKDLNDNDVDWHLNDKKIYVADQTPLKIIYQFYLNIELTGKTLTEIKDELEALKNDDGDELLSVSVDSEFVSEDASKLLPLQWTEIKEWHLNAKGQDTNGLPLKWAEVKIIPIWDEDYVESLEDENGSLYLSKYVHYYETLVKQSKQFWGSFVPGVTLYPSEKFPIYGMQYLKTIPDAELSNIDHRNFRSGIGYGIDLLVTVGYDVETESGIRHYVINPRITVSKDDDVEVT